MGCLAVFSVGCAVGQRYILWWVGDGASLTLSGLDSWGKLTQGGGTGPQTRTACLALGYHTLSLQDRWGSRASDCERCLGRRNVRAPTGACLAVGCDTLSFQDRWGSRASDCERCLRWRGVRHRRVQSMGFVQSLRMPLFAEVFCGGFIYQEQGFVLAGS